MHILQKSKQIEVIGHKQSTFILHNKFKLMAYGNNNLFHNSEDSTVKAFNETAMTLISSANN